MMSRKPTQVDVAKRANVSQAMVSYVLNDNMAVTIPSETRQRILCWTGRSAPIQNPETAYRTSG